MAMEYSRIGPHLEPGKTNTYLAESIAEIYKRNNCWTWYDDYSWCDTETFIQDIDTIEEKGKLGALLPINLIDIGNEFAPVKTSSLRQVTRKIRRKLRHLLVH
jgi:hypothetical protein